MKHKKKWIKYRHKIVRNILFAIIYPYARIKYRIKIEHFKEKEQRQYLILYNHQTAFDQFFVGMTFKETIYYLASEDLFSNGIVSSIIRFLVAPIPIKKQSGDVGAVMNCIRVAREGGTIAIAPEGNRTYSGKTEYINPAISALARKLKLPIAFVKIEGGYGVHPRWSDVLRKGKMRVYVSKIVEPEEYSNLDNDALTDLIRKELYINEAKLEGEFFHKKSAEYLERAIYVCPDCGLSTFESHNDEILCTRCNKLIRYLPNKKLEGKGLEFPFKSVNEWYDYQCDFVSNLNLEDYHIKPMYRENADVSQVIVYKNKIPLQKWADLALFGNRIVIDGDTIDRLEMSFDDIDAISVLGKNKLNIYYNKKIYQIKGNKRFNALKYVNIYYSYRNLEKEKSNGKFLGL